MCNSQPQANTHLLVLNIGYSNICEESGKLETDRDLAVDDTLQHQYEFLVDEIAY